MSAKNPEEVLPGNVSDPAQSRSTLWLAGISAALASGGLRGFAHLMLPMMGVTIEVTPNDGLMEIAMLAAFAGAAVTGVIVLRRIMPEWRKRQRYLEFMPAGFGCWAGVTSSIAWVALSLALK